MAWKPGQEVGTDPADYAAALAYYAAQRGEIPAAPAGTTRISNNVVVDQNGQQFMYDERNGGWNQLGYALGQYGAVNVVGPNQYTSPATGQAFIPGTTGTEADLIAQNRTAAATASQLLYNALRGMPYVSAEFLNALSQGKLPAPRTVTPQTLKLLNDDTTLSDAFFSVVKANALYPDSYLAEIGRFMPTGLEATPSFI